jgi:hypothetical protein
VLLIAVQDSSLTNLSFDMEDDGREIIFGTMRKSTIMFIWNWFGDRELSFASNSIQPGALLNNWPIQMLKCVDFLAKRGRFLYVRFKDADICEREGMNDEQTDLLSEECGKHEVLKIPFVNEEFGSISCIEVDDTVNENTVTKECDDCEIYVKHEIKTDI